MIEGLHSRTRASPVNAESGSTMLAKRFARQKGCCCGEKTVIGPANIPRQCRSRNVVAGRWHA